MSQFHRENPDESQPVQNTDRELWRETSGDFYADSIHVTLDGNIGINVGGRVLVMPLKRWFEAGLATQDEQFYRGICEQSLSHLVPSPIEQSLFKELPDLVASLARICKEWLRYRSEQPLLRGVHVGTDPGSQPVELPKTFEHFKYELRDEYHTFDRAQVDFDMIEQHDPASLENWIVPASLEDVHVGHDPVTGEQQFLVEVKIQPQLPSNGFVLKAEDG